MLVDQHIHVLCQMAEVEFLKYKKETVAMEAKDPVCKMHAEKDTKFTSTYKGKQYGFCSVVCKEMFDKKPEKFVKK